MSTLKTLSQFYYGHTVTINDRSVDFSENGGPEIQANLNIGSYTLDEYRAEWQRVLRTFGTQNYVVAVNRTTGILRFAAPVTFTLKASTGTRIGTGAWSMVGINADKSGTSIVGDVRSGKVYRPQFLLDNYTSPEDAQLKESASVNISASGVVQTLQFGDGARMKCNIIAITDKLNLKIDPWYENATGVADARDFLKYLITKAKVEFMPDWETPATFYKLLLDSTKSDRNGVGFELSNMRTPDVYQTGDLVFRKVLS